MKRTELKNRVEFGIRTTCSSWGQQYLMIDESSAFDSIAESFGGESGDYEAQRDSEKGGDCIDIYELNGNFYAVDGEKYIRCGNPDDYDSGLLDMYGQWANFDK